MPAFRIAAAALAALILSPLARRACSINCAT